MVKLFVGHKGSGKTKKMIELANSSLETINGSIVFINKNQRLMYDLKYKIRVVCMEDFPLITNVDEYIGFLYGVISQDHDIELIFIDSILHYADINTSNVEDFLERLNIISTTYGMDFIVSLSADKENLGDFLSKYEVLN
ncbi:MAG: hypothetical protein IJM39_05205 [Firmicutes bacterium]|nr:hypothetical protein [Bacillota bacterium]